MHSSHQNPTFDRDADRRRRSIDADDLPDEILGCLVLAPHGNTLEFDAGEPSDLEPYRFVGRREDCCYIQQAMAAVLRVLARHSTGQRIHVNITKQLDEVGRIVVVLPLTVRATDPDQLSRIIQFGQWIGLGSVLFGHGTKQEHTP